MARLVPDPRVLSLSLGAPCICRVRTTVTFYMRGPLFGVLKVYDGQALEEMVAAATRTAKTQAVAHEKEVAHEYVTN